MARSCDWRLTVPGRDLYVHTDVLRDGEREFDAILPLQRRPLDAASLRRVLCRDPLMTAQVVDAIHWHALRRNTRTGSRRNISAHYNLGNEFFPLFLSPDLMYSSGIWAGAEDSLDGASTRKLDRIRRKLDLKPDDDAIKIGTDWGVFALYAVRHYGCLVTTTTISREQHALTAQRVKDAGLEHRVTLLLDDYRDITGRCDKLVSIEMIEAIGAFIAMWEVYLAYGERGFRERSIGVAQLLMARPGHRRPAPMPALACETTHEPAVRSELQA